jgi:hypothetical protein
MNFNIDIISDLHNESWDSFDWTGQPTSPYCIVAGDVCRDREVLVDVLTHLGQIYKGGVFYIDGNDEHRHYYDDLAGSYSDLSARLENIKNVVYLQDNVIIINDIAILASNGWWTFDFDSSIDYEQCVAWLEDRYNARRGLGEIISDLAYHDVAYMINSIKRLQTLKDVKKIICVTHTVPDRWIIDHDIDLVDSYRYNTMGNKLMSRVLSEDTEHKIVAWVFGHYHKPVDRDFAGIRWVNNCRGRGDTEFKQVAYNPKIISI